MAKHKRSRRLAGFGLAKAEHQRKALSAGEAARTSMQAVRRDLANGHCHHAIRHLTDAAFYQGELYAHGTSRSMRIAKRKKSGKPAFNRAAGKALDKLMLRVRFQCAKGE